MDQVVEISSVTKLRRANKAELAEIFDVSVPAVNGWVRRGCPVVKRGSRCVPWVFDAIEVAEWRAKGPKAAGGIEPELLPPSERKAWYESETKRRELQVRDKELLPVEEVEEVVARTFAHVAQFLASIPDNLERRCGLSGEMAEQVDNWICDEREVLVEALLSLGAVDGA